MIGDLQKFNSTQQLRFSNEWISTAIGLILCLLSGVAVAEVAATTVTQVDEQNIVTESEALKEKDDIETNQEMHLPTDEKFTVWEMKDVEQNSDKIEKKNVLEQEVTTKKLKNIVPPIQFKSGGADIPANYTELLRGVLDKVKNRKIKRIIYSISYLNN